MLAQRDNLTRRIAQAGGGLDARSLVSLRGDLLQQLQQVEVLQQTVSGTLSALAGAPLPTEPVEPRPLRNAALVFAACLFFGTLLAFALEQLRQRVRSLEDLRPFALPVLGILPPLPGRTRSPRRLLWQTRQGAFREQMDFVRVGLLAAVDGLNHTPAVGISSAQTGEGKSTISAGLVGSLAAQGRRVLLLDADIFRRRQQQLWLPGWRGQHPAQPEPVGSAELWPQVAEQLDLAAPTGTRLEVEGVTRLIRDLSRGYDIVIVDLPPLLRVADALVLATRLDGLVLVADTQTERRQLERAVQEAAQLGVNLLGFVLNRFREHAAPRDYAYSTLTPDPARVLP